MEKNSVTASDGVIRSKNELRKLILQKRDGLTIEEHKKLSSMILTGIMDWNRYKNCDSMLIYVSFRSEADTYELINNALCLGKKVYCPKVSGDDMIFYRIDSTDDLVEGYMGIMEPRGGLTAFDKTEGDILVIMPGSVFDTNGNRIGYGKGFYDRFLAECQQKGIKLTTAALAFSLQVVDNIKTEEHDYKVDYIITEKEIYGL